MAERAFLVSVYNPDTAGSWSAEDLATELEELAHSCRLEVCGVMLVMNRKPNASTLIGQGKIEELSAATHKRAEVIVFGADLSPSQQRNLEDLLHAKTIDRTQLILDVFARRARSLEGKVQVELAQLNYVLPRLSGKGIMLSRLGGGIGTRGPGEQKLELDRRRIRDRIARLKSDLAQLAQRRSLYRAKRERAHVPTVALVGYTNAGKSTLFNALTGSSVMVQDRLFSTLDPTVRRFKLPNNQLVLFIDTVGLLNALPHHLIDAFGATLEEVRTADLLLHVLDASHERAALMDESVQVVLDSLTIGEKPRLVVLNKADLLDSDPRARDLQRRRWPQGIFISAANKSGFDELQSRIEAALAELRQVEEFQIPLEASHLIHTIYEEGEVIEREDGDTGVLIRARIRPDLAAQIRRHITA